MMVADLPDVAEIQALYDTNRFLDAYERTREYWGNLALLEQMSPEQLVLAGRLCRRLGDARGARQIMRRAMVIAPDMPLVQYFADQLANRRTVLQDIRQFEDRPRLKTRDTALQSSYLASSAVAWAAMRDFERAYACLEDAQALGVERAWCDVCRTDVLLADDERDAALAAAESAWEQSPGMPSAAYALARVLGRMGRMAEIPERLYDSALTGQSFEVAGIVCFYLCALAERAYPDGHETYVDQARKLADRLPGLAPLAERSLRLSMAMAHADLALLTNDRAALRQAVAELPRGMYDDWLDRLQRQPNATRKILRVRQVMQKHNTCLPTSVEAVLSHFGETIDGDALATAIEHGGSSYSAATDWLTERGYHCRGFIVTAELATRLIAGGVPFILGFQYETSAHATAAIGLDPALNLLLIHDPSRERWARVQLEHLGTDEAPLGPEGLLIAPPDRPELLDLVPEPASRPATLARQYFDGLRDQGPSAVAAIADQLAQAYPYDVHTRYVQIRRQAAAGDLQAAMDGCRQLLAEYPENMILRRLLLYLVSSLQNTAMLRETLRDMVQRALLPGLEVSQTWQYPPSTYICQYADLIGQSADHHDEAEHALTTVLRRQGPDAEAFNTLGLLWRRQGRDGDALLPLRLAACLELERPDYARDYVDALNRLKRLEDGLDFLRERARRCARRVRGAVAWVTLIDTLEDYGYPGRAVAALDEALEAHDDSTELLDYAIGFHLRRGQFERARSELALLELKDVRWRFLQRRSAIEDAAGNWRAAMQTVEQILQESPHHLQFQSMYLDYLARRDGQLAALDYLRARVADFPEHDAYERMLLEQYDHLDRDADAEQLLRSRLQRNPDDGWAWRELGHRLASRAHSVGGDIRERLLPELRTVIDQCQRTCPGHEATLSLQGRHALLHDRRDDARTAFLASLRREPAQGYLYRLLWDQIADADTTARQAMLRQLEDLLFTCPGELTPARELAECIANRDGLTVAAGAVDRWIARAPNDRALLETRIDLVLNYGEGATDTQRILPTLEKAVADYPNHLGFTYSLAQAYAILTREDDERALWQQLLRQQPRSIQARIRLAELTDDPDQTLDLLRQAVDVNPSLDVTWRNLSRHHWLHGQVEQSLQALRDALHIIPQAHDLRGTLASLLRATNRYAASVTLIRDGLAIFPRRADLWHQLAIALRDSEPTGDPDEIEAALRKAIDCDQTYYDAMDDLAIVLTRLDRHGEAIAQLENHRIHMDQTFPIEGRIAWVMRERGNRRSAMDKLVRVLKATPRYPFGWNMLMHWLEEDEDWDHARSVLAELPDALADMDDVRARRLAILEAAGTPAADLDPQWEQLTRDFPRNERIAMRRVDRALERARIDEADHVMEQALHFHPQDTYLLSRLVQIRTAQGRHDDAIRTLLDIGSRPEDEGWPERNAWDAIVHAGQATHAITSIRAAIASGAVLRVPLLIAVCDHIKEKRPTPKILKKIHLHRLLDGPDAAFMLDMLRAIDQGAAADPGRMRGLFLWQLREIGYPHHILRYYERHKDICQTDLSAWSEVAGELTNRDQYGELRRLARRWHQFTDHAMVDASYYIISLLGHDPVDSPDDVQQEIQATAQRALDTLPRDHTGRFMAIAYLQSTLRLGQLDHFRDACQTHAAALDDDISEDEFVADGMYFNMRTVKLLRDLLSPADPAKTAEAHADLTQICRASDSPKWLRRTYNQLKSDGHA